MLFVPSGNVFYFQSIDTLPDPFEFLVRAGRAVLVVAVQGTLERGPSPLSVGPNQMRDRLLQWRCPAQAFAKATRARSVCNSCSSRMML